MNDKKVNLFSSSLSENEYKGNIVSDAVFVTTFLYGMMCISPLENELLTFHLAGAFYQRIYVGKLEVKANPNHVGAFQFRPIQYFHLYLEDF